MLERMVAEARQKLDATPMLSDAWFCNHKEWKQLTQLLLNVKIEYNLSKL